MRTVLFLGGESRGDALSGMGRSYKGLFNAQGYDFVEINLLRSADLLTDLKELTRTHDIEFACAWVGYGSNLAAQDQTGKIINVWENVGIPFLAFHGDSPAYYFDAHVVRSSNFASLYGFPEHAVLRRRLPKLNGVVGQFMPLLLNAQHRDSLDFKRKAAGQLLFLKNGNDPAALWNSWDALNPRPLKALRAIATHLAADLSNDAANQIDDVVTTYFLDHGIDLDDLPKLRLFFIAQLDDYLRRVKSTMMAEALMDFPVQIRGNNWQHLDFSGKRATYVDDADYETSNGLMREALGTIDMSPNVGLAPHDRVLRSYAAYTLCLTNEQEYLRRDIPHHKAVSFVFEREAFRDKVADILANPTRTVELGIEVAESLRAAYPPADAITHLLDVAALIRTNRMADRLPDSAIFFRWPPQTLSD